jgi:hypothetical protein
VTSILKNQFFCGRERKVALVNIFLLKLMATYVEKRKRTQIRQAKFFYKCASALQKTHFRGKKEEVKHFQNFAHNILQQNP